ncbi:hypothetical protein KDN32_19200 [Nocardioides sp. J2M5]|uniref:hypothetical protein n=1 Tax=Nocardioides palaemonis TaxID=2829810 RepID=UPI001BA84B77|nr:hypothetical protein [Nocardioides palaemonis]MBS2939873.1 hypothetical protein [Nocardioides palaemonis]
MRTRLALGSGGVALALYGLLLLLSRQDPGQWLEVALWLAAGVVAHDVLLSGVVIGTCLLGSRLLPDPWRAPAAIALVVWGALSVVAVPVLAGGGVRADNPTLLDRPYVATWWVISAIVVLVVAATGFVRARRRHEEG